LTCLVVVVEPAVSKLRESLLHLEPVVTRTVVVVEEMLAVVVAVLAVLVLALAAVAAL
jgi:hypothetical protein